MLYNDWCITIKLCSDKEESEINFPVALVFELIRD